MGFLNHPPKFMHLGFYKEHFRKKNTIPLKRSSHTSSGSVFWIGIFWFSRGGPVRDCFPPKVHAPIWVFPKIGVPQNGWFIMKTLLNWMIWGYHHFRKPPHKGNSFNFTKKYLCEYMSGQIPLKKTKAWSKGILEGFPHETIILRWALAEVATKFAQTWIGSHDSWTLKITIPKNIHSFWRKYRNTKAIQGPSFWLPIRSISRCVYHLHAGYEPRNKDEEKRLSWLQSNVVWNINPI